MATVAPPLRIGPADHGRMMTLEEFREAEELDGYRYELARGVLEVTEVPNDPHGVVVCNLYRAVSRYDQQHPGVILRYGGGNEFRFWLPHMISSRHPDLGVVLLGAPKDWRGRRVPRWPPRSSRAAASNAITKPSARSTWLMACSNTGSSIPCNTRPPS